MHRPTMNRSLGWLVSAILLAALVSCSDDPSEEVEPGPVDTTTPTETTGEPDPEPPTEQPTVSLPSLPIGGTANESEDVDVPNNQCVDVNWIVDQEGDALLVEGIEVQITGATFTPPELFVEAGAGCGGGNPPCTGYVFTDKAQACNLAVEPLPGAELLEETPFVALTGVATCELTQEECDAFGEAVANEENLTIDLLIPEVATTETTG
jgi:hypothetical protein